MTWSWASWAIGVWSAAPIILLLGCIFFVAKREPSERGGD